MLQFLGGVTCIVLAGHAVAAERIYSVGKAGWSLEQFGTDVAVLRSNVSAPAADNAGLLLACSAGDRRIRLMFPDGTLSDHHESGKAMIQAASPPRLRDALVVQFKVADAVSLVVGSKSAQDGDPVGSFAKLLTAPPQAIDLLVSWGAGPVVLTHLDVIRLSLRGGAPDRSTVSHFLSACQRPTAQQAD